MVFKIDYRLMQDKVFQNAPRGSILQYFRPSLSYHFQFNFCSVYFKWPLKTGFTVIPLFPPTGDGVVTGGGGGVKLSTTKLYCILNPLEPEMSLVLYEIKKTCSRTPMNPIEASLQSVTKGFPSEKQLINEDRQYNVLHISINRNMTKPIT